MQLPCWLCPRRTPRPSARPRGAPDVLVHPLRHRCPAESVHLLVIQAPVGPGVERYAGEGRGVQETVLERVELGVRLCIAVCGDRSRATEFLFNGRGERESSLVDGLLFVYQFRLPYSMRCSFLEKLWIVPLWDTERRIQCRQRSLSGHFIVAACCCGRIRTALGRS